MGVERTVTVRDSAVADIAPFSHPLPTAPEDRPFAVRDLGILSYADAQKEQTALATEVAAGESPDTLLLVQHPPVLTLGAGFHEENLLFPPESYRARGIEIERTDRGGDVTYHGPGQLVMYPVFDVSQRGKDLHRWLRDLEGIVIDALAQFGIEGSRLAVNSGVWIGENKVCAMGIKLRRWVSTHGLALNCDVDLAPFGTIVPCGIRGDFGVTSISRTLERTVTVDEAKPVVVEAFARRFGPVLS